MVKKPRKTSLFPLLMALGLAFAIVFAGIFIIAELNHDCAGADCQICLEIETARRLIEAFGRLGVSAAVISFIISVKPSSQPQNYFYIIQHTALKVKLNC